MRATLITRTEDAGRQHIGVWHLLASAIALMVIALGAAPAAAEPGNAEGGGWVTTTMACDGQDVTMAFHGGLWSTLHSLDDGRHFVLVRQRLVDLDADVVLFDITTNGHANQGPFTSCAAEIPSDVFGFTLGIEAEGFWRP